MTKLPTSIKSHIIILTVLSLLYLILIFFSYPIHDNYLNTRKSFNLGSILSMILLAQACVLFYLFVLGVKARKHFKAIMFFLLLTINLVSNFFLFGSIWLLRYGGLVIDGIQ